MDPVERVKNMVRHALVAKPDVSNQELYDRALEIAPAAVDGLSLRQFHARYRLPVVRHEMARRPRPPKKERPAPRHDRTAEAGVAPSEPRGRATRKTRTRQAQGATVARSVASADVMRPTIRATLVDFAVELEGAQQRSDLIRVMGGIDTFVDRILDLVQRHFNGDSASVMHAEHVATDAAEKEARALPPAGPGTGLPHSVPAVDESDATTSSRSAATSGTDGPAYAPAPGGAAYPAPPAGGERATLPVPPAGGERATFPVPPAGGDRATFLVPPASGERATLPVPPAGGERATFPVPPAGGERAAYPALPSSGAGAVDPAPPAGAGTVYSPPDKTPEDGSDVESDTPESSGSRVA